MNHVLVDFENVHQVDLTLIGAKAVSFTLLVGAKQTKLDTDLVEKLMAHASSVQLVKLKSSGVTAGTLSGTGTFSAPQMADLIGGLYYVNLHTTTFGGGELRAQLVPEPSTVLLSALGMLALARRRR